MRFHRKMKDVSGCLALCQVSASAVSAVVTLVEDLEEAYNGEANIIRPEISPPMLDFLASCTEVLVAL